MVSSTTRVQQSPPTVPVVAGVDTHKDVHHVAVLTLTGQLVDDAAFPATAAGYQSLLDWVSSHGSAQQVGVELTGSYGAGLTRHLQAAGVVVAEVNTADKATRARRGKDDRTDAIAAAQKVLAGMTTAVPKDTTGPVESIRVLLLTRNSAVTDRTRASNQIRDLLVTAPAALREQLTAIRGRKALLTAIDALPATRAGLSDPGQATVFALQRLTGRIRDLDVEIRDLDAALTGLVTPLAPTLLAGFQVGILTAAQLLITAAGNSERIGSEAKFAHLTGTAPVPVSSGKTNRMRLHRGGDRQANRAIHLIAVGRLKNHGPTQAYVAKKLAEGKSKKDAIRSLKRYIARGTYHALRTDHITA
jgi:transposase